tara:strand:+ start:6195 stop:6596 length:402 start_codon:yes stop_codon:yes gene_type:complete
MNENQKDLRLLPTYFKSISIVLLVLSIVIPVGLSLLHWVDEKEVLKTIALTGIINALFLLSITKDKEEDELTLKIRLKAYTFSFLWGVGYATFTPFINLIVDGEFVNTMNIYQLLMSMLFMYFMAKLFMKRNR